MAAPLDYLPGYDVLEEFDELLTLSLGVICSFLALSANTVVVLSVPLSNMDLHYVSYCATMWAFVFNMFSNTELISSIDRQCLTYVGRWATS